jgi:glucose/arabinose dehydrogenase
MKISLRPNLLIVALAATLTGCGEMSRLPSAAGMGPNPALPQPVKTLLPTLNIAPAQGWAEGSKPLSAEGTTVNAFAASLDHPRWVYVLPNGDVLVAESNAPPKPDGGNGIRGWVQKQVMKRAGAVTPSANRITLFRDVDGDGVAEVRSVFLQNLASPFGMALIGDTLYIANTDAIVRVPYKAGDIKISATPQKVVNLPAGTINHHWTKNIIASADGSKLYATVGSNSNVAERGMEVEAGRAAIWEIDLKTGMHRIFASGLRNPNGMAWAPETGALWTVANERDELGSDLVPDYLTSVKDGGFYGWPYSYFGSIVDERVKPPRPDLVSKAIKPDYALGSHTASLGLASAQTAKLGERFANGMFIGQHGSWNRKPHSGYKVIFVPFANGQPAGEPVDVLSGFLSEDGKANGRPVGVAVDTRGALLVADDVGNVIWRVSATSPTAAEAPTNEKSASSVR